MIGVVVTAVMVSAVVLPSGAAVLFAVTEQDAAVLVPRPDGEVFGVLRHVLECTADGLVRAAFEIGLIAADVAASR